MNAGTRSKSGAAGLSIASNTALIAVKGVGGLLTGSVAILSDAIQSTMDLAASVITFVAVRKADEPADASHRYGHQKVEDLSAGIEALLLLLGAAVIAFQAVQRLLHGGSMQFLGVGIVVTALAAATNLAVSARLGLVARATESTALKADGAHLRTDAMVSLGVLGSLIAVALTGASWIDPVVGLGVATAISLTGVRILIDSSRRLVDETLPDSELDPLREVVESFVGNACVAYHDLRARHAGSHHQVDLHLQFAAGISLEDAHATSHRLQRAIADKLPGTSALVHLEPQHRVRPDRIAPYRQPASDKGTPAVTTDAPLTR